MPRGIVKDNKATSQRCWRLKLRVVPTEENNRKTGEEKEREPCANHCHLGVSEHMPEAVPLDRDSTDRRDQTSPAKSPTS